MLKRVLRGVLHRLSRPIYAENIRTILVIGSGDAEYLLPVIKKLKGRFHKAKIIVYPHSSQRSRLPELQGCEIVESGGYHGLWGKLRFFWHLRNIKKDLIVSLWTNEPEYNRFKLMAFFLNGKYHLAFNEEINFFQVSPEHLGLIRMHYHMRKGTTARPFVLRRAVRRLIKLVLYPVGILILFIRIGYRLLIYGINKKLGQIS